MTAVVTAGEGSSGHRVERVQSAPDGESVLYEREVGQIALGRRARVAVSIQRWDTTDVGLGRVVPGRTEILVRGRIPEITPSEARALAALLCQAAQE